MRSTRVAIGCCVLLLSGAASVSAQGPVHFAVFTSDDGVRAAAEAPVIRLAGRKVDAAVVPSQGAPRTALIVLDTAPARRAQVRRLLIELVSFLAAQPECPPVRLAFPLGAGFVTAPIRNRASLVADTGAAFDRYLPEPAGEAPDPVLSLDLAAAIMERVDAESGPFDALFVLSDAELAGDDPGYMAAAAGRLFTSLLFRRGSSLSSWTDATGPIRRIAERTGGRSFAWTEDARAVAAGLSADARNALVIRVSLDRVTAAGEIPVDVGIDGRPVTRSPGSLWRDADGKPVPNLYSTREGLAWLRRALEAEAAGNMTNVVMSAESALRLDPWNASAHAAAGRAQRRTAEWPSAYAHLSRAIDLGRRDEPTVLAFADASLSTDNAAAGLARLEGLAGQGAAGSGAVAGKRARLLAANGRNQAAVDLYAQLLRGTPDDDGLLAGFGAALRASGRPKDADAAFRKALAVNPANVQAICHSAEEAAAAGRHEEAERLGRDALAKAPALADAHYTLARLAEVRDDWGLAVARYEEALRKGIARADLEDGYARALARQGRAPEAVRFLRQRVEADPSNPRVWRRLSDFHEAVGNLGEAAAMLEAAAAALGPEGSGFFKDAAELRERRGESGQALLDYRALLRTAPPELEPGLRKELTAHMAALDLLSGGGGAPGVPAAAGGRVPEAQRKQASAVGGIRPDDIEIPGGLASFARAVGVDVEALAHPDGLERTLFFIIGAPQSSAGNSTRNQIADDVISYLRNYDALVKYMKKQGLVPGGFEATREARLSFPLLGPPDTLKRTQKFLSFFGVRLRVIRNRDRSMAIQVELGQGSTKWERQQFLRKLGVNLNEARVRELPIRLEMAGVPMLGGARAWRDILLAGAKAGKSPYLLERVVRDPRAMRLYLALARCSEATRAGIIAAAPPGGLLPHADILFRFGYALDFTDGELVFPGDAGAWRKFLGVSAAVGPESAFNAMLKRDGGRPIALYAAVASAPHSVQKLVTAPGRLEQLYLLASTSYPSSPAAVSRVAGFNLGRTLRGLGLDARSGGSAPPEALQSYFGLSGRTPPRAPDPAGINGMALSMLFRPPAGADRGGAQAPSQVDLLLYLASTHPEALNARILDALTRDLVRTRTMLDLVLDLSLPAEQLERYVEFGNLLVADDVPAWNANRVRSCQAVLHLIALLRRQGGLTHEEGLRLFSRALDSLKERQEAVFAQSLAAFVSRDLVPALKSVIPRNVEPDVVLAALAGTAGVQDLQFEGRSLKLDAPAWRLQRMKATLEHQEVIPLGSLLSSYALLGEVPGMERSAAVVALKQAVGVLGRAKPEPGSDRAARDTAGRAADQLLRRVDSLGAAGAPSETAQLAQEAATALHLELGLSLLAYSYAFHGAPEVDVLAFDSRFIRKHEFGVREQIWAPTTRTNFGSAGLRCAGSLSGLAAELGGLETAQVNQDFGSREGRDMLPVMLSTIRAVEPFRRTDRAQEFVALCVRVGREVLAAAAGDDGMARSVESFLQERLPPRRRLEVIGLIHDRQPRNAGRALSPSELFLLGDWYRTNVGGLDSPPVPSALADTCHLGRLRSIVPGDGTADATAFWREVGQYGMIVRSRLGLSRLSILLADSFEDLEGEHPDRLLFERLCDLKIRLAELNHAAGLPAALGEVQGELALRDILPRSATVRPDSWRVVLDRVASLGTEQVREWMEELLSRGALTTAAQSETDRVEIP
jgi:tetratricopeptide (TPR) repeat protein